MICIIYICVYTFICYIIVYYDNCIHVSMLFDCCCRRRHPDPVVVVVIRLRMSAVVVVVILPETQSATHPRPSWWDAPPPQSYQQLRALSTSDNRLGVGRHPRARHPDGRRAHEYPSRWLRYGAPGGLKICSPISQASPQSPCGTNSAYSCCEAGGIAATGTPPRSDQKPRAEVLRRGPIRWCAPPGAATRRSRTAFALLKIYRKPIGFPVGPSGTTQKPSVSGHFYIIGAARALQKRFWNRRRNRKIIKNLCVWRDPGRPHGKTSWVCASFSLLEIRGGRAAAAVTTDLASPRARHLLDGGRSVAQEQWAATTAPIARLQALGGPESNKAESREASKAGREDVLLPLGAQGRRTPNYPEVLITRGAANRKSPTRARRHARARVNSGRRSAALSFY